MVREEGFYWVKAFDSWRPAEWRKYDDDSGYWDVIGWIEGCHQDSDLKEIGPRMEPPTKEMDEAAF